MTLVAAVIQVTCPCSRRRRVVVRTTSPVALSFSMRMFIVSSWGFVEERKERTSGGAPRRTAQQQAIDRLEREHRVDLSHVVLAAADVLVGNRAERVPVPVRQPRRLGIGEHAA